MVAQSQAIDAKRDREPASMERSEHDFDLEDPITAGGSAQKQRSRKSKNKSSRSKVMELENSINLSPLRCCTNKLSTHSSVYSWMNGL